MPELSVIIPAYNEESRLPATLASVYAYLSQRQCEFELLVIDDGSQDRTAALVQAFGTDHPGVRVISYQPNHGKGHAIRTGIMAAKGTLLLINDADGSSPIEEVERLEAAINDGAQVVIGSRAKPDATRKVDALAYRRALGNTFNAIVQNLLLPGIYDTQCGFKLFKADVGKDIFSVTSIDGFGFDVEALYIARLRGYTVAEVPINWHNVEGSKVNVVIDSPKMFWEVLIIRLRALLGRYKRTTVSSKEKTT
jgi:dolichyl-phosphate beta-glucosyltransferase